MMSKTDKMIPTEGLNYQKADFQDSHKYLVILWANGSHEEAARKSDNSQITTEK